MEPLTIPGTLEALQTVRDYVTAAANEAGLDKKAAYRLRLAVDEIASNSVIHGYEEANLKGNLYLRAVIDDHALTLTLEDSGNAFDPLQHPPPSNLDDALEDREIGGLGVFLALQGVDRFHYEYVGNRNRNVFTVNRPLSS